jgi:endonuclease/exonuclease/phosphatase family metal-dependent hydrolase
VVTSPRQRDGRQGAESWVAIVGKSEIKPAEIDIPFERMAAAARATVDGREVIVYGAVLPWNSIRSHAPELVHAGESASDTFVRVLREQAADIERLRRRHKPDVIIWAGDFNQTVGGPNYGGSRAKRDTLIQTLATLDFEAWNRKEAHARAGLQAIDLICGRRDQRPVRQGRIDPVSGDIRMSDHAGYWVEF